MKCLFKLENGKFKLVITFRDNETITKDPSDYINILFTGNERNGHFELLVKNSRKEEHMLHDDEYNTVQHEELSSLVVRWALQTSERP